MARYLTLSRAARLVGTKRGALQKKIRAGELSTFEGMLELNELLRVYPNVELEDSAMIERVDRFIENALTKVARSTAILPDAETLLARVSLLSQELAAAKAEVGRYAALVDQLKPRVAALDCTAGDDGEQGVRLFKSWFLHALEGRAEEPDLPERLLAKEAFLRVMAAHVRVTPSGHEYFVEGSDNLLEAGLRSGISLPYGCNDTSCGQCKARIVSGRVRPVRDAKFRLQDSDSRNGMVLACCCAAVTDIVLDVPEARSSEDIPKQTIPTRIDKIEHAGDCVVVQARFDEGARLRFLAGQYARVQLADGSSSDSAIASCPCDERTLEFHLSKRSNPGFWRYASEQMEVGEPLAVHGPRGDFLLDTESTRPLLFIAVDSGFAAIKSLIEHAMALDAAESMQLVWMTTGEQKPYRDNLCRAWADALDEFAYTPISAWSADCGAERLIAAIRQDDNDLAQHDVYICAAEDQVQQLGMLLEDRAGAQDRRVFLEPIRFS